MSQLRTGIEVRDGMEKHMHFYAEYVSQLL
jgi:hypothetical protein